MGQRAVRGRWKKGPTGMRSLPRATLGRLTSGHHSWARCHALVQCPGAPRLQMIAWLRPRVQGVLAYSPDAPKAWTSGCRVGAVGQEDDFQITRSCHATWHELSRAQDRGLRATGGDSRMSIPPQAQDLSSCRTVGHVRSPDALSSTESRVKRCAHLRLNSGRGRVIRKE